MRTVPCCVVIPISVIKSITHVPSLNWGISVKGTEGYLVEQDCIYNTIALSFSAKGTYLSQKLFFWEFVPFCLLCFIFIIIRVSMIFN